MRFIIKVVEWSDISTNTETKVEVYADSYDDIEDIVEKDYPDIMAYEITRVIE